MTAPPDIWAVHVRNCASFAALTVLIWESVITFDNEMNCIWKRPITMIKRLYLFLRYFALVGQISNHIITLKLQSRFPLTARTCKGWYAYQTFVMLFLLMAVETVLMVRVYALYNRSRRIGLFLFLVFLTEFIIMMMCQARMLRISPEPYDSGCFMQKPPLEVAYLGAAAVTTQIVIWTLTMIKRTAAVRYGWGRTPLVSLMARDGALVFMGISVIFGGTIPYSFLSRSTSHVVFPCFTAFLSITGCRLIINMQTLAIPEPITITSDFELTTGFEPDSLETESVSG